MDEVGADRVGIRVSPFGGFLDVSCSRQCCVPLCMHAGWCAEGRMGTAQCEDEHPYALHTYLLEELNKLGIAYVHFIEPRALHSMGVASPNAEFAFERKDQSLDVRFPKYCAGWVLLAALLQPRA